MFRPSPLSARAPRTDLLPRVCLWVCLVVSLGADPTQGQTWNQEVSGTASKLKAVTFLSTSRIVAVGQRDGGSYTILISTNGGVIWNSAAVGGAPPAQDLDAVAFQSATGLAVGKTGVILRSTDSGASWAPPTTNPAPLDLKALAFNGATAVAVGKRSGGTLNIVRSTDGGANWSVPTFPAINEDLKAVTFVSPTVVVAVGKAGTIVRSTDGGANWTDRSGVTAQELKGVDASGNNVVAVGVDGGGSVTIVYSTDGGSTWASATVVGGGVVQLEKVLFLDASTVVAAGKANGGDFSIFRSTDGGANWSVPSGLTGGGQDLKGLAGVNQFVIAVGKSASLLVSEDLGASWTLQTSASAADLEAADAINPVIAVGAGGEILLSNDQATGAAASAVFGGILAGSAGSVQGEVQNVPVGGQWLVPALLLWLGWRRVR